MSHKKKNDKFITFKFLKICLAIAHLNRKKRQVIGWEKIFRNHKSDKGPACRKNAYRPLKI